ncbi:undecaprenyl-diphosphate phosphatase [Pelagibacteraceae bacterium]|jgi:undecaprenyl-diphosphatase|nr:undecaprenyl-diphosphate phosphatase [Pelagibacteraceae bacterium]MDC0952374.1 undecaprenyl-diphosphate phosphatase [Pelagibacteraceae bacterium]
MIELFLLSLIQGITEFLPISSSSHLIIFSKITNFDNQSLSIDVSLHIGSFLAVITFFREEIINFTKNKDLLLKILFSSIPVMVIGFFLVQTNLIEKLRSIEIIGWMTILFGILLFISDKFKLKKKLSSNFTYQTAIIIGFFQILSLIPGVSRSGITITAARILNFKRLDAAKISFLMSIPTLGAVTLFGLKNIINSQDLSFSNINLASIFLSFLFSLITIKYFLQYIKTFSLNLFVTYRLLLGTILLFIAYL